MRRFWILLTLLFIGAMSAYANEISFKLQTPPGVVKGQQFRIAYTLSMKGDGNLQASDLAVPQEIKGFDILFGPAQSRSSSTTVVNGQMSSENSVSFVYTLLATEEGTFTIPAASIKVGDKTYTAAAKQLKVLPPDKNAQAAQHGVQPQVITSNSTADKIDPEDAFIRAIFSKTKIAEQEAVVVTYRFYTVLNVRNLGKAEFPEFEGFMTDEFDLSPNRQLTLEHYKGRNYSVIDIKKTLIFPQRSGKIIIPAGTLEFLFEVRSGQRIHTPFGPQDVMTEARKVLKISPVNVDVSALPEGKPLNFSGGVGSFSFSPSISAEKVTANEPVTIKLEIKGTGNIKLIKNPEIEFPKEFETYDPKIINDYKVSDKGQSGVKTIEYMFIPRQAGKYTVPHIEFSYYDIDTRSYKTLSSPSYSLDVARDANAGKHAATSFMNQNEVKVEQDIRYLKTDDVSFKDPSNFIISSSLYFLWYLIPTFLFAGLLIAYRKQIKANADIARMRTRKANKVATRRLKLAKKYMHANNKDGFYEEVLRAVWGYLSDKLTIPVADLSRENVETELVMYGANASLITQFISILDTCEFARYAPAESEKAMANLYAETVDAIGEMENTVKIK